MRLSDGRKLLLFGLGYFALTCVMFTPLVTHLRTGIPHDLGDPLLNTWILWWNARAVPFTAAWWNGPIFWPLPDALALSEHLFGISVVSTPMQWLGAPPQLAYNVVLLVSWSLSAVSTHALCRRLTGSHAAGAIGAVVFGFNPYRLGQIPHLQVLACWWMPLALLGLHNALDAPSPGRAVPWLTLFAGAWLLQAWSNGYFLFYFSFLVALWFLWFAVRRATLRRAAAVAAAGALACLILAPTLLKYRTVHERWQLTRGFDEVVTYSADFASLVNGDISLRLWPFKPRPVPEQGLYPGVVAVTVTLLAVVVAMVGAPASSRFGRTPRLVLLALAAMFFLVAGATAILGPWRVDFWVVHISARLLRKPLTLGLACLVAATVFDPRLRAAFQRRSALAFYTLAAVVCFSMCLGPYGMWNGERVLEKPPYWWLMKLPGMDGLRVPARFAMVAALPLAVAAALGFRRLTRNRSPRIQAALGTAIVIAIVADSWPTPFPMLAAPQAYALPASARNAAVLELPMNEFEHELEAMYRAIGHERPLVNGSSGYFPQPYNFLRNIIAERDPSVLPALATLKPLCIVIDRRLLLARVSRQLTEAAGAQLVGVQGDFSFYRLDPPKARPIPASPVPIRAVTAPGWPASVGTVVDGRLDTFWATTEAQRGGETVQVELAEAAPVGAILLSLGDRIVHYPRHLIVEVSEDGQAWTEAWAGPTGGAAYLATITDQPRTRLPVAFEPRMARFIRLRQTGSATGAYWSIAELEVRR